ncbi:Ig-like domain-containing protein [Microbulbifer sp. Q7]|uniref:Ig-like domain-containing protein n=1 Tax=Microbulbifer sp. Q7 TaxID=1785091 RepID=UPI00187C9727|nr:Ig-like domain-containing protein [Microbulbifer sp. Q7]
MGVFRFVLLASLFSLAACGGGGGGGGGSNDAPPPVEKKDQAELSFAQAEAEYYLHSDVQENELSGGSGSGAVTYSSSDSDIVTVDVDSGTIELLSVGSATITASKAGDSEYKPASATYLVTILEADTQAPLRFDSAALEVDYSLMDTVINPLSGGSGDGALMFSSSDDTVATVDEASGEVTLLTMGTATIHVTKAASGSYAEASAEYQLTVVGPPTALLAELGKTGSQLALNGNFSPTDFYRYTNEDCDIENYAVCSQGALTVVSTEDQLPVEDDYVAVGLPAYVVLERAGQQSSPVKVEAQRPPFVRRMGQAMVSFKGKIFVIAGQDNSAGESGDDTYWYNDIWSTEDGINWVQEVEEAEFSARAFHEVVEFQNSLYLISGEEGIGTGGASQVQRDVWKSDDGVTWQRLAEMTPFMGQGQSIVFDGKIWVIGDSAFSGESKIYSSTDGLNWDLELADSPFGSRQDMAVYSWAGKLFVAGGMGPTGSDELLSDVWSSPDGRVWTKETDDGGYMARVGMTVTAFGGELLMIGGHSFPNSYNSVYSSSDGVSWTLSVSDALTRMNQTHSLTQHMDKLWVYTGLGNDYFWFTEDGQQWQTAVSLPLEWQAPPEG